MMVSKLSAGLKFLGLLRCCTYPLSPILTMATFTLTPWPEAIPYEQQSYQVPDTKEPGQTGLRSLLAKFGTLTARCHYSSLPKRRYPRPAYSGLEPQANCFDYVRMLRGVRKRTSKAQMSRVPSNHLRKPRKTGNTAVQTGVCLVKLQRSRPEEAMDRKRYTSLV